MARLRLSCGPQGMGKLPWPDPDVVGHHLLVHRMCICICSGGKAEAPTCIFIHQDNPIMPIGLHKRSFKAPNRVCWIAHAARALPIHSEWLVVQNYRHKDAVLHETCLHSRRQQCKKLTHSTTCRSPCSPTQISNLIFHIVKQARLISLPSTCCPTYFAMLQVPDALPW